MCTDTEDAQGKPWLLYLLHDFNGKIPKTHDLTANFQFLCFFSVFSQPIPLLPWAADAYHYFGLSEVQLLPAARLIDGTERRPTPGREDIQEIGLGLLARRRGLLDRLRQLVHETVHQLYGRRGCLLLQDNDTDPAANHTALCTCHTAGMEASEPKKKKKTRESSLDGMSAATSKQ
jgi:hypothetical protein